MEHQLAKRALDQGTDKNTKSEQAIITASNLIPCPKPAPNRRVSFSFVTPEHSIVTYKDHPSITEEKEIDKDHPKLFGTVESLEEGEAVREDAGTNNVETGGRFCKSSMERKWSLASSFSFGSKSTRSSRSSPWSNESKRNFRSSESLARSTIHGGVECFINDLSLHPHFLYWPIPAFFLFIILAMVVFNVLAIIFS